MITSTSRSPLPSPVTTAPGVAVAASSGEETEEPSYLSVMCPTGFTSHSAEGLSLSTPLFARVTFRAPRNGRSFLFNIRSLR